MFSKQNYFVIPNETVANSFSDSFRLFLKEGKLVPNYFSATLQYLLKNFITVFWNASKNCIAICRDRGQTRI